MSELAIRAAIIGGAIAGAAMIFVIAMGFMFGVLGVLVALAVVGGAAVAAIEAFEP